MANQQMDLAVGVSVVGEKATRDALNRIGRAVGDAGKEMQRGAKGAEGFKEVGPAVREALGQIQGLAGPAATELGELASAFLKIGTVAGPIAAIAAVGGALAGLTHHAAEASAAIIEGANRVGTSVENYQGLSYALEQSGSSAEGMEKALRKISQAQEEASRTADKYDESARMVEKANERARESAENYSDALSRINSDAASNASERRRSTAEEILRVQQDSQKAASRNANRAGQIEQDAGDHIARIKRDARLADQREQRRIQRERERLSQDHYRKEMQELRKFHQEQEAEAEKAAHSLNKFEAAGISLFNGSTAKDPTEVFKQIADKIAQIQEPAERAAKAVQFFGQRFGTQMVEALQKGGKGIDDLIARANKLGLVMSKEFLEPGKQAKESFEEMEAVVGNVFTRIGLAFTGGFEKITKAISEKLGYSHDAITHWAESIAKFVEPIFSDIAKAITGDWDKIDSGAILAFAVAVKGASVVIRDAFLAIGAVLQGVAKAIDDAFGTKTSAAEVAAFGIAIAALVPIIGLLAPLLIGPVGWVAALAIAGAAIYEFRDKIAEVWRDNAPAWLQDLVSLLGKVAEYLGPFLIAAAEEFFKDFLAGIKAISAAIQFVYDKLKALANLLGSTGVSTPDAAPGAGFATGGSVHGPGGIDQVPARLTAGEYVVNKTAADRHRPMLDAINHGKGYALGGLVESIGRFMTPAPLAFAAGGSVPAGGGGKTPVHLHVGGNSYAMHADDHVAGALVRVAAGKEMSSGGTKPSWFAGRP